MASLFLASLGFSATSQADTKIPKALEGIDIVDRSGQSVDTNLKFKNHEGREVTLGSYFEGDKPLVVVLAYFECPMLCSMVLNGLLQGMKEVGSNPGTDYRVLVASFDERDSVSMANRKRDVYLEALARPVDGTGFDFVVGDKGATSALASSLGFQFRWDEKTNQFAHAAGAFVITPEAKISRTLYGISFPGSTLTMALREAKAGGISGVVDRMLLFCFHYDPQAGSYVLASVRLMKAGGGITLGFLLVWLLRLWRTDRARTGRFLEQHT